MDQIYPPISSTMQLCLMECTLHTMMGEGHSDSQWKVIFSSQQVSWSLLGLLRVTQLFCWERKEKGMGTNVHDFRRNPPLMSLVTLSWAYSQVAMMCCLRPQPFTCPGSGQIICFSKFREFASEGKWNHQFSGWYFHHSGGSVQGEVLLIPFIFLWHCKLTFYLKLWKWTEYYPGVCLLPLDTVPALLALKTHLQKANNTQHWSWERIGLSP